MRTWVVKSITWAFDVLLFLALAAPGVWAEPTSVNLNAGSATTIPLAAKAAVPAKESIPWSELGARAGKQHKGEALSITTTETGARLRTDYQRLRGEVTEQGLALESTVTEQPREHFALRVDALGRKGGSIVALPRLGKVETQKDVARWVRPGVTEEYSVSVDGVRQDFMITERPKGDGPLLLELALSGAKAETADFGVRLIVDGSSRQLAYNRLKAWDATGRELPAHMAASDPDRLIIVVEDAGAVWPVRIDPTFSDANWISMGVMNGTSDYVSALAIDSTGNLYVGGSFDTVGGVVAKGIVKWNGSAWISLGSGMNDVVNALAIDGSGNLYAGGTFTTAGDVSANYIAKWNGSAWSPLGTGITTISIWGVMALAIDGSDNLYVGGEFTTAGSVTTNNIAKWDGNAWSPLGSGMNSQVNVLAIDGSGNLYAGGGFTTAGSKSANYIAKWNGSAWSSLGTGMAGIYGWGVIALAIDGSGNVYAGGTFITAGGVTTNNIAKWNGSAWSSLGSGVNGGVNALAIDGSGSLYAGGYFTTAGSVTTNYVAKWNGSSWVVLGSDMNGPVNALAIAGSGSLYAVGYFTAMGSVAANHIAKWDGNSWSALGISSGLNGQVKALAIGDAGNLYVGGEFTNAGGVVANGIAKWNGSAWGALGSSLNGSVVALAVDGSGNLYTGGYFTTAGGVSANYIAKWNGSAWGALGSGMNGSVVALAVDKSGNLYVGGGFTTAGGVSANHIAKWNGSAWSPLGSGRNGTVNALAIDGSGNVYVGGNYIEIIYIGHSNYLEIAHGYVSVWNGSTWDGDYDFSGQTHSFPPFNLSPSVTALAIDGSGNLYAGGDFTAVGAVRANCIAKWDGRTWSALGSGMNDWVNALAIDGSGNLYAGGEFTSAGGVTANRIAKWAGGAWSPLGSGMNNPVNALAFDGASNLYVGGQFTIAGGKYSSHLAKASFTNTTNILTYTAGANGTITGATSQAVVYGASGSQVTAVPNQGYFFVQWSDGSTANPRTDINVTGNINVTAYFATPTNTLTYTAGANGTIAGDTHQTVNYGASGTAVTAIPNIGCSFMGWSDGSIANPRTDTNVTTNISVTAIFALNATFTTGNSATFTIGTPGTFTVTAGGVPTPALSATGALPSGVTFIDNGNGSATLSGTPAIKTNGVYHLTFVAHNGAGPDATQGFTLTVATNTTSPVVHLSTLSDGAVTTSLILNVSGNATSPNGIQTVTYNGSSLPFSTDGSFSYPVHLSVGSNTITVAATDNADQNTSVSRTITLTPTAPTLSITSPADCTVTQQTAVTVSGTSSANTTVTARVNGAAPQTVLQSGTSFSVYITLATGLNTIELTATDVTNTTSSAKLTIFSNPTAPELVITNPAHDLLTDIKPLTLTGTVSSLAQPVSVSIAFDGQTFTPSVSNGAFQQQLTLATEKTYAIVVTATDANTNSSVAQRNAIYSMTSSGDMSGDGQVDVSDALMALRIAVNLGTPTADELKRGDVAPLVHGVSVPDGKMDIEDVILILRKAVGLAW